LAGAQGAVGVEIQQIMKLPDVCGRVGESARQRLGLLLQAGGLDCWHSVPGIALLASIGPKPP
jgi:hypothetical protein